MINDIVKGFFFLYPIDNVVISKDYITYCFFTRLKCCVLSQIKKPAQLSSFTYTTRLKLANLHTLYPMRTFSHEQGFEKPWSKPSKYSLPAHITWALTFFRWFTFIQTIYLNFLNIYPKLSFFILNLLFYCLFISFFSHHNWLLYIPSRHPLTQQFCETLYASFSFWINFSNFFISPFTTFSTLILTSPSG